MTAPRTVQLHVNARAGNASQRRVAALRAAFAAQDIATVVSEGRRPQLHRDADHLCIVGGDGTLRDVATALQTGARAVPMSVYPAGTVNLLARECAYSPDPADFVRRVRDADETRGHYPASINGTILFSCASVGPDSAAVAAVSPRLKRLIGRFAYVFAFLGVLLRWPRSHIDLIVDGAHFACEAFYVAKGRHFAGGWSFAPEASIDKPILDVLAFQRMTRLDFARFAWAMLRGSDPVILPYVERHRCVSLSARASASMAVQADGDIVAQLPVAISVQLQAIPFA